MYYIGINVHKKKCVTTIKGDAKKVLKRTSFDNDITGNKRVHRDAPQ